MKQEDKVLYKCIVDRYDKVVWTHKIHEKQSEISTQYANWIRWSKIVLSALAAGGVLNLWQEIFCSGDNSVGKVFTIAFATLDAIVTMLFSEGRQTQNAETQKKHALKVHDLRNKYHSLLTDIVGEYISTEQIIKRRDELEEQENVVYDNAPQTSSRAVKLAGRALKDDQDSTSTDEESELFLPTYLQQD